MGRITIPAPEGVVAGGEESVLAAGDEVHPGIGWGGSGGFW